MGGRRGAALAVIGLLLSACEAEPGELRPPRTETSGDRLRAVFAEAGEARAFLHYLDLETGIRCVPGPDGLTGGPDRCWPILEGQIRGQSCQAADGAPLAFVDGEDAVLGLVPGPSGLTLIRLLDRYEGDLEPFCRWLYPDAYRFEEVPVDILAAGRTRGVPLGPDQRVRADVFEGDDGSRLVVDLVDTGLGVSCYSYPVEGTCRPNPLPVQRTVNGESWVDAATCATRAVLLPQASSYPQFTHRVNAPDLVELFEVENRVARRLPDGLGRVREVPDGEGLARLEADGSCVPAARPELPPGQAWAYFEPLAREEQAELSMASVGDRLRRFVPDAPELASLGGGFRGYPMFDAELDLYCTPAIADGTPRCVPYEGFVARFADPGCTEPVVEEGFAGWDQPGEVLVFQELSPRVDGLPTVSTYAVGERLESGVVYGPGGRRGCLAFNTATRFRRLERRPADELPEVAIVVE